VANGNLFGVPMPFVLLILISAVAWVVLHRSVYGRYLFATGRNAEASRYAGINTRRIITLAYVASGFLTAISGIIFAFYTNSVSPANHGNAYELYGIAAAVLGGCSLRGGEGSIVGILIGAALLQVLRNLVNLLGIPSSLDFAVMGAVILIGVMADQFFTDRRNRRQVVMLQETGTD
jgi:ribose transport system permease protein